MSLLVVEIITTSIPTDAAGIVIAITGIAQDTDLLKDAGFKDIYTTKPDFMPLEEAMKPGIALQNIKNTVLSIFNSD